MDGAMCRFVLSDFCIANASPASPRAYTVPGALFRDGSAQTTLETVSRESDSDVRDRTGCARGVRWCVCPALCSVHVLARLVKLKFT